MKIELDKAAAMISRRCGLSVATCTELIQAHWTYQNSLNEPSRWLSPVASLAVVAVEQENTK